MKQSKVVIFDFDGTLANTIDLAISIYNDHAEEFGVSTVDHSELTALRKMGYKKAMKHKGIKWSSLPRIILFIGREMKKHMDSVQPYDGVIDLLEGLKREGFTIGILTSNSAGLVQEFLDKHGFPKFDFVVAEKTIFGKDKALKKIIKRYELDPDSVLYVGDEPRDITASRKAGVVSIGVSWGLGGVEGLEPEKPNYLVRTTSELEELLRK